MWSLKSVNKKGSLNIHLTYRNFCLFCRFFSFFFCFFSVFFCLIIFFLFMATGDKSCCSANFFALFGVSSGNNLSIRNLNDKVFFANINTQNGNTISDIIFLYFPFQQRHLQRHQRQLRQLLNLYCYQNVRRLPRAWTQDGAPRRTSVHDGRSILD